MKDKYWDLGRRIIGGAAACILGAGICLGTGSAQGTPEDAPAPAEIVQQPAAVESKDEIIYGTLSAAGAVENLYVVNHFLISSGTAVTDYGAYTRVANLTTTDPIALNDGVVTFQTSAENFYYQGDLRSTQLPWRFRITYFLDGEEISPGELGGRDGHLKIQIAVREDGTSAFGDSYMLQIQATLDSETARNIDAPGASQAGAGSSQIFAYTVLPKNEATYTLEADVEDFEMTGIQITGVPYSVEFQFPDLEDSLSGLEALPDAIAELNAGVGELEDGTQDMQRGAEQLEKGSGAIRRGLSLLDESGAALKSGSRQVRNGLDRIAGSLADSGIGDMDFTAVSRLPEHFGQLAEGLSTLSDALSHLQGGFSAAWDALEGAVDAIPAPSVSQEEIADLLARQTDPQDMALIGELVQNYEAAQTVRGTFSQVRQAFEAVSPALDESAAGLGEMVGELTSAAASMRGELSELERLSEVSELESGLHILVSSYSDFDDGLKSYLSGVSELSSNYAAFDAGLSSLAGGADQLSNGVGRLHDGTQTLSEEIADLPGMIQEEIDKMKEEYMPADFEPVSFTSDKNTDTAFVQFILQCEGVSVPAAEEEITPEEEPAESFWDRLGALFS